MGRFTATDAAEARAVAPVPLLLGLTGPSGSGKTFSALRLATGIQEVVGGDIFVVDTEQRRALHYADKFTFKHVNFQAPFGALDYLEALRFCKAQGAGVVIIDSCSHEHDGPGGLLEQHEAELTRMAGDDYKKRDRMTMLAWQKPKGGRRKLINAITTELAMPVIFCFRAKKTTKPKPGSQPIDMGFSSIGADEWLFELALNALMLPGSEGVPTWHSEFPGEQLAIKLPGQFRGIAERGGPMTEAIGRSLAKWASGIKAESKPEPKERFQADDIAPAGEAKEGHSDEQHGDQHDLSPFDTLSKRIQEAASMGDLRAVEADMRTADLEPDDVDELMEMIGTRRGVLLAA